MASIYNFLKKLVSYLLRTRDAIIEEKDRVKIKNETPRDADDLRRLGVSHSQLDFFIESAYHDHFRWRTKTILKEVGLVPCEEVLDSYISDYAEQPEWMFHRTEPLVERFITTVKLIRGMAAIKTEYRRKSRKNKYSKLLTSVATLAELEKLHSNINEELDNIKQFNLDYSSDSEVEDIINNKYECSEWNFKKRTVQFFDDGTGSDDESNTSEINDEYYKKLIDFMRQSSNSVPRRLNQTEADIQLQINFVTNVSKLMKYKIFNFDENDRLKVSNIKEPVKILKKKKRKVTDTSSDVSRNDLIPMISSFENVTSSQGITDYKERKIFNKPLRELENFKGTNQVTLELINKFEQFSEVPDHRIVFSAID